jgi:hypothetical protein
MIIPARTQIEPAIVRMYKLLSVQDVFSMHTAGGDLLICRLPAKQAYLGRVTHFHPVKICAICEICGSPPPLIPDS